MSSRCIQRLDSSRKHFVLCVPFCGWTFLVAKSEWARHTWECVAPIHIRGYCPHPSNHLRRRIHQPSLLPHNIHRNGCAVQDPFYFEDKRVGLLAKPKKAGVGGVKRRPSPCRFFSGSRVEISPARRWTCPCSASTCRALVPKRRRGTALQRITRFHVRLHPRSSRHTLRSDAGSHPQSSLLPAFPFRSNGAAAALSAKAVPQPPARHSELRATQ